MARLAQVDGATGKVLATWVGGDAPEEQPVAPPGATFVPLAEGEDVTGQKWDGAAWVPDPPPVIPIEDRPVTPRQFRRMMEKVDRITTKVGA